MMRKCTIASIWFTLFYLYVFSAYATPDSTKLAPIQSAMIQTKQNHQPKKPFTSCRNFIRLVVPQFLGGQVGSGLSYERIFGVKNNVALLLPVNYMQHSTEIPSFNNTNVAMGFLLISPGIKYYPGGIRQFSYSIGGNLQYGFGKQNITDVGGSYRGRTYVKKHASVVVVNGLNMNLTKNFVAGAELGFGLVVMDKIDQKNKWNRSQYEVYSYDSPWLVQFALNFGFGF